MAHRYYVTDNGKALGPLRERQRMQQAPGPSSMQRAVSTRHSLQADALEDRANLYRSLGDHSMAHNLDTQAKAHRTAASEAVPSGMQRALSTRHSVQASALEDRANLYRSMGDHSKAQALDVQAKEHRSAAQAALQTGPRGGQYMVGPSGEKHYVTTGHAAAHQTTSPGPWKK